jgi:hypothetical protein
MCSLVSSINVESWFSPGTPASSTTTTGRHDIAEILLKVALNTDQINNTYCVFISFAIKLMY